MDAEDGGRDGDEVGEVMMKGKDLPKIDLMGRVMG